MVFFTPPSHPQYCHHKTNLPEALSSHQLLGGLQMEKNIKTRCSHFLSQASVHLVLEAFPLKLTIP